MFFSNDIKSEGNRIKLANIAKSNVVETSQPSAIVPP